MDTRESSQVTTPHHCSLLFSLFWSTFQLSIQCKIQRSIPISHISTNNQLFWLFVDPRLTVWMLASVATFSITLFCIFSFPISRVFRTGMISSIEQYLELSSNTIQVSFFRNSFCTILIPLSSCSICVSCVLSLI